MLSRAQPTPEEDTAGHALYSPLTLRGYDLFVLAFTNGCMWRCSTRLLRAHYDRHVGARHLDVGVGTGYFLDRAQFPTATPMITLLDLNPHSLAAASRRIVRYAPRTVTGSVLEPIELKGPFDSIGMNYLLHCLPGTMQTKAAAFDTLRPLLAERGVLFGSTVLGQGVRMNAAARALNDFYNRKRIFTNYADSAAALEDELGRRFTSHELVVRGCVAIFSARA